VVPVSSMATHQWWALLASIPTHKWGACVIMWRSPRAWDSVPSVRGHPAVSSVNSDRSAHLNQRPGRPEEWGGHSTGATGGKRL
jgi:hypothetical protein